MFDSKLYKLGKYRVRITRLNALQRGFGHFCYDILLTFKLSEIEGSLVCLLPTIMYNSAILDLECDNIFKIDQSQLFHKPLKLLENGPPTWPYYRRQLIREPIPVRLSESNEKQAIQSAMKLGFSPGNKIVTLHVREPGWYPYAGIANDTWDNPRNSRIDSYLKAVDFLISIGYTVVRIGDKTSTPINRSGVIDLATSEQRTDLLELYFLLNSHFLISSESGVLLESELTNTPTLAVNVTDPICTYPVRKDYLFILKHVIDNKNGKALAMIDMLSEEYQKTNLRDYKRYQYIDNTSDEILEAVIEMIAHLNGEQQESEKQRQFRNTVVQKSTYLWDKFYYAKKWGAEEGFIGDSRIANFFVSRYR